MTQEPVLNQHSDFCSENVCKLVHIKLDCASYLDILFNIKKKKAFKTVDLMWLIKFCLKEKKGGGGGR